MEGETNTSRSPGRLLGAGALREGSGTRIICTCGYSEEDNAQLEGGGC